MFDELSDTTVSVLEFVKKYEDDPISLMRDVGLIKQIKDSVEKYAPFFYFDRQLWNNLDQFFNGGLSFRAVRPRPLGLGI